MESKHLEKFVHFKGFSRYIHKDIKDAEFFVLSSDFEGLSNALMEAMKIGIPSISINCSGISEIITDNVNGLLVPIKNVITLENAMSHLSENITLKELIKKESIIKSKEWETFRIAKKWEKLF